MKPLSAEPVSAEEAQEFFDQLRPLREPEKIKELCESVTSIHIKPSYASKTRCEKLSACSKLVRTISDDELIEGQNAFIQTKDDGTLWKRHLYFKFTGIADINWNGEGGVNTKRVVTNRLENRKPIDPVRYINTATKLLASKNAHEIAVGLIAVSGRRPTEIIARGSFAIDSDLPDTYRSGYYVRFNGQLKKRGEASEYRIGLLIPAIMFLEIFERFRKMPESVEMLELIESELAKGKSEGQINRDIDRRRNGSLNTVVRKHFDFIELREGEKFINCTTFRATYARLITDRDCPKTMSDLLWASRMLGHFVDNDKPSDNELKKLVTTLGYFDYYTDGEISIPAIPDTSTTTKPTRRKERQIRAYDTDYETIKQLQTDWKLPSQHAVIKKLVELAMQAKKLNEQLIEAQSKLSEAQSQPVPTNLEELVKRLVNDVFKEEIPKAIKEALPEITASNTSISPVPKTPVEPPQPSKDWESVSSEELRKSKIQGAADEKIRRAFLAIAKHNDYTAKDTNDKWAINNRALRQLSGAHGDLVKSWIERHQIAIDDHNAKHGLGQYHNKRHKDAITDVISW